MVRIALFEGSIQEVVVESGFGAKQSSIDMEVLGFTVYGDELDREHAIIHGTSKL